MLYEPVQQNRLFAVGTKYSAVRLVVLYGHHCLRSRNVLTSGTLSRYGCFVRHQGNMAHSPQCQFAAFSLIASVSLIPARSHRIEPFLPDSSKNDSHIINEASLRPSTSLRWIRRIAGTRPTPLGAIKTRKLKTIADVLYYVYRCGILHSAHAPLCGVISGLPTRRFSVRKRSLAKYSAIGTPGGDCPVVVFDPWKLFDDIEMAFKDYLEKLRKASPTQKIRLYFNDKFADCFGIDISGAR